jgi:two-component system, NtrC family, response regulator HydG
LPSTPPAADERSEPTDGTLVGQSPALKAVRAQIVRLGATSSHTLITGESGTGKELVARALHAASRRRKHRFVPVNCGAIPETLFESHLFGHVRGAFTNAVHAHPGLFALAHQGTLFLDEVGELSLALQVKLLRVLEDKEVWALGDTKPTFVDTRIIASTNRDLRQDVEGGRFREDLFYRLNVARVDLPPLRERREDIPLLVEHFIGRLNTKLGRRVVAIEPAALQVLAEHDWPGNVRELEHVLESAMIAADGELISVGHLRPEIVRRPPASLRDAIRRFERQQIMEVLNLTHFDKKEAARRLGLSLASLYRKLEGNVT